MNKIEMRNNILIKGWLGLSLINKMKRKELAQARDEMLKVIGNIEATILWANMGAKLGATESEHQEETAQARQIVIQELQEAKESLDSCFERYKELLDKTIESMS